ncbi:E3 ubiquitin-protein ligase SINAT3 [Apostasia shenzhenica]|uniref:RING-type E3 ubiquitin transferase n=1 Tax=Apostasia shenzhenica TaxID=1088818 RepID=A0A2H9ZR28_9ASPA|nr:E3 ubiquitin-protein ligase SINAT3 [Apostasia shenzhenica]
MDLDSIECVSSCDGLDEEETSHLHLPFTKAHGVAAANGGAPPPGISPATSIHELLECPCHNGHTLCSTCKTRVHNRCPTCRQELGDIRCLALEKVAESLELPCKYSSLGCSGIFPYYSKLKHESQCNFRPYNCPYAGSECSVTGDIPFLVAHLRDDHKVDMHTGCTFNHRYVKSNPREVENATWMLTVFHCFGQYFCLHFEAFQLGMAPVYMAFVRFMGDENEARSYSYSLEVGANGRKLIWEGTPRSIRDSHRKVRDSHDGLIIQRNMALFFSGGDRKELKLRVTGRIWKEQHMNSSSESGVCLSSLCTS